LDTTDANARPANGDGTAVPRGAMVKRLYRYIWKISARAWRTESGHERLSGFRERSDQQGSAAADGDDLAILEECERGEDVAKAKYRKALEEALPDDIRAVVQRQYDGVIRNHDQIRDLRGRFRAQKS
jgi:hypothetical protein